MYHHIIADVTVLFNIVVRQNIDATIAHDDPGDLAVLDTSAQNEYSETVEDFALDESAQWASSVGWGVTRCTEVVLDFIRALDSDIALVVVESLLHLGQTKVYNLANLPFGETVEDDGAGDPVEEFGEEVVPQGTQYKFAGLRVDGAILQ